MKENKIKTFKVKLVSNTDELKMNITWEVPIVKIAEMVQYLEQFKRK